MIILCFLWAMPITALSVTRAEVTAQSANELWMHSLLAEKAETDVLIRRLKYRLVASEIDSEFFLEKLKIIRKKLGH